MFFNFTQFQSEFLLILKIGYLFDYNSESLDSSFIGFLISSAFRDSKFWNSEIIWPLNLMFDQLLFIFHLNLGIDLRDQLLSKYKLKFNDFDLFGIF